MRKYLTVAASFFIMIALGGVYAWSILASELTHKAGFSTAQTQLIFGALIAVFPVTMIFTGRLAGRIGVRNLVLLSGSLFLAGYLLAGISDGNLLLMITGISILAGAGTGFGYWVSLTVPVQWFPERKGLLTGISSAGFGLGALVMSMLSETLLSQGKDVFEVFTISGSVYGLLIILIAGFISQPSSLLSGEKKSLNGILGSPHFMILFTGIFLGTFSGLMIIGNLKLIGEYNSIPDHMLVLGVSAFALANFGGRLLWGFLSDYFSATLAIFFALALQSVSIILMAIVNHGSASFLILSVLTGLGFGGNFVLFAKETAHIFGLENLGRVYPYIFLGYAIAGITGPLSGGLLSDYFHEYNHSILLAGFVSLAGSLLFLYFFFRNRKNPLRNPV
ncbi:MAG: MFS transporter [Bacteroidales bacterium]|jgi:OFA family oxalate/formate antiporter-like MFS transporter|nr:MFS transporter [Bacteroidales bacterium]